jgi:hypothetical protein
VECFNLIQMKASSGNVVPEKVEVEPCSGAGGSAKDEVCKIISLFL